MNAKFLIFNFTYSTYVKFTMSILKKVLSNENVSILRKGETIFKFLNVNAIMIIFNFTNLKFLGETNIPSSNSGKIIIDRKIIETFRV